MNRILKYNLNAKNAYEFARGSLVTHPKNPNKLVYIYKRDKNGYCFKTLSRECKPKELTDEEQKIFIDNSEWAYKYAWRLNKRLCKEVEDNFFSIVTEENLPRVLYYCKIFNLSVPESFHNFATMSAATLNDSNLDKKQKIKKRKSKRYIGEFQKNKDIAKRLINLFIANEWISEDETVKQLLEKF
jgi:hypothetical protein